METDNIEVLDTAIVQEGDKIEGNLDELMEESGTVTSERSPSELAATEKENEKAETKGG